MTLNSYLNNLICAVTWAKGSAHIRVSATFFFVSKIVYVTKAMSFLLDDALTFVKHGPFGQSSTSKEDEKLQSKITSSAHAYRRVIIKWLNKGVSEKLLRSKNLWNDELMKPNVATMGGGAPSGGFGGIIPVLNTGESGRSNEQWDPRYVEAAAALASYVQSLDQQAGENANGARLNQILEALHPYIEGGGEEPRVSGAQSTTSIGSAPQSSGSAEVKVPDEPWAQLWPTIAREYGSPGSQFINSFWNTAKGKINPKTGKNYTPTELKELFKQGVEAVGGSIVDRTTFRNVIRTLMGQGQGLTGTIHGTMQDAQNSFANTWGSASQEQLQELLTTLNMLGINMPRVGRDTTETIVERIKSNPRELELLLRTTLTVFPNAFVMRTEDMKAAEEAKAEPPPEVQPSTREWFEEKTPYLQSELERTGMDPRLQNLIIEHVREWSNTYGGILRGENPDLTQEQVQAQAIVDLLGVIRRSVSAQHDRDASFYVNSEKLIELAKMVIGMFGGGNATINADELKAAASLRYESIYRSFEENSKDNDRWKKRDFLMDLSDLMTRSRNIARSLSGMRQPESERERDVLDEKHGEEFAERSNDLKEELGGGERAQNVLRNMTSALMHTISRQAAAGTVALRIGPITALVGRKVSAAGSRLRGGIENTIEARRRRFDELNEEKELERLSRLDEEEKAIDLSARERLRNARNAAAEQARQRRERELNEADVLERLSAEERARRTERMYEELIPGQEPPRFGAGGGPPEPPGPPGGGWAGIEVRGPAGLYIVRASRADIIQLLKDIRDVTIKAGAVAGSLTSLYQWVKWMMLQVEEGRVVDVDIAAGGLNPPEGTHTSKDFIPPNVQQSSIDQGGMYDNSTYEIGIDGKPKLFPQPSNALSYKGPVPGQGPIPWAPEVPRYQVTAPKITQPGGTIKESDQLGGWDVENEEIIKLMDSRPDIAAHITNYNMNVDKYNTAIMDGNSDVANSLRKTLQQQSQEIVGEAGLSSAVAGLGKSVKDLPHAVYNGTTISGEYAEFFGHKTKNERTKRLGLDKFIDEYNYLADRLNTETYQERTPLANVRAEFDTLRDKINTIEVEPELALGHNKARFIPSKYPTRVQELAEMALRRETLNLTRSEEQLLKEYPEVGNPILRYSMFQRHNPGVTEVSKEVQSDLDSLSRYKNLNYKLPQMRAFAEGPHRLSPTLHRLVDRISNSTPESMRNFIVTKEERDELERFPDLKEKVVRFEEEVNRLAKSRATKTGRGVYMALTPEYLDTTDVVRDFQDIRDSGYRAAEAPEYSMEELESTLRRRRAEFQDAYTNFMMAQQSGAQRSELVALYNRVNAARVRLMESEHDAQGRGTFLADRSRELLPQNERELEEFRKLQSVEAALQGHPDVLEAYNKAVGEDPMGQMSPSQYYIHRMKLLRDAAAAAGVSDVYETAIAQGPSDLDETIVRLPDDAAATEQQGEGTERANTVDPDEAKLFMMSGAQNQKQFRNWLKFSYVAPGFGLGGPAQNILQKQNVLSEGRRFAHAKQVKTRSRTHSPIPVEDPRRYQQWINPSVSSFGRVHMKDAFHDNYLDPLSKKVIWSNPFGDINSTRSVRDRESIYDPDYTDFRYDELTGTRYGSHACPIGEVSRPAEYRFTNERYYQTNGYNNRQQNMLNLFPPDGERTMITKDRAGLKDRGIEESPSTWHRYGKTRLRPMAAPGFRSTRL